MVFELEHIFFSQKNVMFFSHLKIHQFWQKLRLGLADLVATALSTTSDSAGGTSVILDAFRKAQFRKDTTQDPPILWKIEQLKEVGIQSKELFVECWDTKQDFLADGFSKNEDVSEWPVCSLFDDKQHVGQGLGNWSKSLAVNLKEVELKCSYLNAFMGICNFALKDTRHLRIELNCLLIWGFNRNIYLDFKCFSQTHFWYVTAST